MSWLSFNAVRLLMLRNFRYRRHVGTEELMIYRVFRRTAPQVQTAEINDPSWPLIRAGEKIPLTVDNRDGPYTVTEVGALNMNASNKLAVDLWVDDFLPGSKPSKI